MKRAILILVIALTVSLVPVLFVGVQFLGPTAPVPTTDPIIPLNEQHLEGQETVAAYVAAHAALTRPSMSGWSEGWQFGAPLPDEAAAWLAENTAALTLSRQAAEMSDFWAPLQRDRQGMVTQGDLVGQLRELVRLWRWRAAQAAAAHDPDAFEQAVVTIGRIGDHLEPSPLLITRLVAIACDAAAAEFVLHPFTWPDATPEALASYARAVRPALAPPPSLAPAFQFEQQDWVWTYAQHLSRPTADDTPQARMRILVPTARVAGELALWYGAFARLADAPVDEQLDARSPGRQAIAQLEQEANSLSLLNLPASAAGVLKMGTVRTFEMCGRLIALQRGVGTALAVFEHRRQNGTFPESLDAVAGVHAAASDIVDPFTRAPFLYRRTDEGFTLYSAGFDGDDDGGRHDARFGAPRDEGVPPDGDYVFWPPPPE